MKAFTSSIFLLTILATSSALANNQLILARDAQAPASGVIGVTDVIIHPGFDDARVAISVDGASLAEALRAPYRVTVDFGPAAVQHKITVTAFTAQNRRVRWTQTINAGLLPLTVKVQPLDLATGQFEAEVTAPNGDPIAAVELWDGGQRLTEVTAVPYRFTVPPSVLAGPFVQVTARTKSGEEAADFWSRHSDVHVETMDVRTVPIYVSVVDDRNGATRDDIDASLFRILDNGSEGKILQFSKAFDQPISIALLLDASASMTYSMQNATQAAQAFVQRTLKQGDRCAVYAVRDTPRREQPLTGDLEAVRKSLASLKPAGRTALYDAIESATRELRDEKSRRAIVILTDGGDTSSMAEFDEIDKLATESGIPLYFIAYNNGDPSEGGDTDRMKYLANQTGGFVVTADASNLQQKYGDIEKDLRAQYAILYQVADFAKPSQWRKINVQLKSPKLTARTIRGYFAP
jgi:VWFA-related protein